MEVRVNLVILGALVALWAGLSATEPAAAMDPAAPTTAELEALEDRFADDPTDHALALQLAESYLEIDQPGLAIAAIRSADASLLDRPMLAHRLAQAYEQSGRMLDAYATADLAAARCARSLGTSGSNAVSPEPADRCGAREYAVLEMHRTALGHMVEWGIATDGDPRARVAYDLAIRRASIASAR